MKIGSFKKPYSVVVTRQALTLQSVVRIRLWLQSDFFHLFLIFLDRLIKMIVNSFRLFLQVREDMEVLRPQRGVGGCI